MKCVEECVKKKKLDNITFLRIYGLSRDTTHSSVCGWPEFRDQNLKYWGRHTYICVYFPLGH